MIDRRTLAACCLLAVPTAACLAQSSYTSDQYFDNRWYVTPFGAYIHPDSDRIAKNGWGGGLGIGKPISPSWNIELRPMYEELDQDFSGPGKYKNWSGTIDAQWFFMGRQGFRVWQSNSVQPYLVGGIGAIRDKVERPLPFFNNESKTSFLANLGAGIVWPFSSWGRLVADVRYRYDDNRAKFAFNQGSGLNEWLFSVGLQIPLGPPPVVAQAAAPAAPVAMPPPPPPPPPPPRKFELASGGTFFFDKAELTPAGRSRVDAMAEEVKAANVRPSSIVVIGYTDPLGPADHNQRLSVARANAVRDEMVKMGVPPNVIQTEGRGASNFKVTEADCKAKGQARNRKELIACLEPNRRVEITVTGQQAP